MSLAQNSPAGPSRNDDPRIIIDLTSDSETDQGDDGDSGSDGGVFMSPVESAIREAQRSPLPPLHQLINLVDSPSPTASRPPSNSQELEQVVMRHNSQVYGFMNNMAADGENEELAIETQSVHGPSHQRNAYERNFQHDMIADYVLDEDLDDSVMARLSDQNEMSELPFFTEGSNIVARHGEIKNEGATTFESRDECISSVARIFPGICLDYVAKLYDADIMASDRLIAYILDKVEKGTAWPKAKDSEKHKKRKRDVDQDEQAALRYGATDRIMGVAGPASKGIRGFIRGILREEFSETPMNFIDATLSQLGYRLFSAYQILEEAQRNYNPANPPYNKVKKRNTNEYTKDGVVVLLETSGIPPDRVEVLEELVAARRIRTKADQEREAARQIELEEELNTQRAEAEGSMKECGCCCCDFPLNRMVHCDADEAHWFCRRCALTNAETQIGASRYDLECMSMEGCTAGFSREQRSQFLNETTIVALERNEQEAVLRMAGIENLASCPFCPYAAEYPPIEVNREFECKRPDCEKVSCRLCKEESHIPKSCEEYARDVGLSIRREVEEAMTAALIRKCNKCQTPFIKEEGCNKMTCTRNGCNNIQCYVCSKSCGYDHFNDRTRGGKEGNCPLFENAEERHDREVKEAERVAMAKIRSEHPEYTEDDLRIKVSQDVQNDEDRRRQRHPRGPIAGIPYAAAIHLGNRQPHNANGFLYNNPGAPVIDPPPRFRDLARLQLPHPGPGEPHRFVDVFDGMLHGRDVNLFPELQQHQENNDDWNLWNHPLENNQFQMGALAHAQVPAPVPNWQRFDFRDQPNGFINVPPVPAALVPGAPRVPPVARMPDILDGVQMDGNQLGHEANLELIRHNDRAMQATQQAAQQAAHAVGDIQQAPQQQMRDPRLADYHMQLQLLEQQRRARLAIGRLQQ